MKRLILFLFLFFLSISSVLVAEEFLYIYKNNIIVGKMTIRQFQLLTEAAKQYDLQMQSEKTDRVRILLVDNPYIYNEQEKTYKAKFKILWFAEDNQTILKELTMESIISLDVKQQQDVSTVQEWKILYAEISKVGFPLMSIVSFILILIVVAL